MKIVFANEMGGGWGHILRLKPIARELTADGNRVVVFCHDAAKARVAMEGLGVEIEQTPAWIIRKTGFSLNFAQCIWGNGYWDEALFRSHFAWWMERFRAIKPDYVLSDYAPTALLSALTSAIPRGIIGTGFTVPPAAVPMPSLHPWLSLPEMRLAEAEAMLVERLRSVEASIDSVADIFRGAQRFLTIFRETDSYENRVEDRYWGPILDGGTEADYRWPEGSTPRVLFYMSMANRCLKDFIDHIGRLGLSAIGYVKNMPESERHMMESPTIRIHASPIDLSRAASECDLAVTHGGLTTTTRLLLAGKPLLLCPEQLEQTLLAYRLQKQGLCEFASFFDKSERVREKFDCTAASAGLREKAAAFSAKYSGYDSPRTVKEISKTCLNKAE